MRRVALLASVVCCLLMAGIGSAEATTSVLPAGCTAASPTIAWVPYPNSATLKSTEVRTTGISCTGASGWTVTATQLSVQRNIASTTPTGTDVWKVLGTPVTSAPTDPGGPLTADHLCAHGTWSSQTCVSSFPRRGLVTYSLLNTATGKTRRVQMATVTQYS